MMIVMKEGATEDQIAHVVERVEEIGCTAHISKGEILTLIGAIGAPDKVQELGLEGAPGVDHLTPISKPYKLASRQVKEDLTDFFRAEADQGGAGDPDLLARQLILVFDGASARSVVQAKELDGLAVTTAGALMDVAGVGSGAVSPETAPTEITV